MYEILDLPELPEGIREGAKQPVSKWYRIGCKLVVGLLILTYFGWFVCELIATNFAGLFTAYGLSGSCFMLVLFSLVPLQILVEIFSMERLTKKYCIEVIQAYEALQPLVSAWNFSYAVRVNSNLPDSEQDKREREELVNFVEKLGDQISIVCNLLRPPSVGTMSLLSHRESYARQEIKKLERLRLSMESHTRLQSFEALRLVGALDTEDEE
ncbi:MAG: hypothetical protein ABIA47_04385 [bacterium]